MSPAKIPPMLLAITNGSHGAIPYRRFGGEWRVGGRVHLASDEVRSMRPRGGLRPDGA